MDGFTIAPMYMRFLDFIDSIYIVKWHSNKVIKTICVDYHKCHYNMEALFIKITYTYSIL